MKIQTFQIHTQDGDITSEMIHTWLESIGKGHKASVSEDNEQLPYCEVDGCHALADYEGWYRAVDFSGNPSGLIQRRQVCDSHKNLLIGNKT